MLGFGWKLRCLDCMFSIVRIGVCRKVFGIGLLLNEKLVWV